MPMSYDSLVKTATMDYVARIRAGNIIHTLYFFAVPYVLLPYHITPIL